MKKIYLPLFVITMVVITVGILIFQSKTESEVITSKVPEIFQVILIIVLFLFGIIISYYWIRNEKHGLPADDELSIRIRRKAAAWSYYFSLYVWVGALYLSNKSNLDENIIMGAGILTTVLLFGIFSIIFNKIGHHHE